ncbi:MAG: NADP-specific glutamate dehydrogenase [Proteobacteria bacterium]|nr:NADP-specific glutamate dehydrogenase [Pseudomonadota bacterium]
MLERLTEPDRVISFLVCWEDDSGFPRVNRGWRVQHSNLIGPYKGGLRFHPTVNESVFKFLAFEQTFKNALTGLPIGGAKGGSDFNPRECSDREIMRFCQSFMNELYRHIGDKIDIPAGDINVGNREIGYLFGQYRRLANTFSGVLTGKDLDFGGSHVRLEATGFGLVYFVEKALARINQSIENKVIAVSGSGNVALHAALKSIQLGARVVTLSSSKGTLLLEDGFSEEDARTLITLKGDSTEKLKYLGKGEWLGGSTPWDIPCDIALPCATQNELRKDNAECLVKNGCMLIAEGANMPCDNEALRVFEEHRIQHVPGKASNAGGVALSALEMGQNASFSRRGFEELNNELRVIMTRIHELAVESDPNATDEYVNYRRGANIAAFKRVGHAMVLQGIGS